MGHGYQQQKADEAVVYEFMSLITDKTVFKNEEPALSCCYEFPSQALI